MPSSWKAAFGRQERWSGVAGMRCARCNALEAVGQVSWQVVRVAGVSPVAGSSCSYRRMPYASCDGWECGG